MSFSPGKSNRHFGGQASTQRPQPLHSRVSMVTLPRGDVAMANSPEEQAVGASGVFSQYAYSSSRNFG